MYALNTSDTQVLIYPYQGQQYIIFNLMSQFVSFILGYMQFRGYHDKCYIIPLYTHEAFKN